MLWGRRAFDFITHSFTTPELTEILRFAVDNITQRRSEHVRLPAVRAKSALRTSRMLLKKT